MSRIRQIHWREVARPLRTRFVTALGGKAVATSVLVRAALDGGECGLGEVPTSFVQPHETPAAIKTVLAEARRVLRGRAVADYPAGLAELRRRRGEFHMTLAGLETALFRADLAARGEGEWAHWGGRLRRLTTDITIPMLPEADDLARWLGWAATRGFATYKVKVGGDVPTDLALVGAVVEQLRRRVGRFVIRLDGNQGYTADSCRRMLDGLAAARIAIELFEQPLPKDDLAGLKRLRGHCPVPVILDETVFDADDCRRAIADDLADGVNIKVAKSGIAGSAAILDLARAAGLQLMIGCMTETMVGLSAGIRLAAGTGAFDYVDLNGVHFMHHRRRFEGIDVAGSEYVLEGEG